MQVFAHLRELRDRVGQPLASSDWLQVDQAMIDGFAQVTRDPQWIHVDPARAAQGPFGGTIAHGFLTLSLLSALAPTAFRVADVRMGVNGGFDRVRLITPVPAGARIRAHFALAGFEAKDDGARLVVDVTVELEGAAKPACVATWVIHQFV